MGRYASDTCVAVESSLMEIRRTAQRYGAGGFQFTELGALAGVTFECSGRTVRIMMTLPSPDAKEFRFTETGKERTSENTIRAAWEQECRRSWRALALVIKAKLEAVASGITTFDNEFLAHIVLPDGNTVAYHTIPSMHKALEAGTAPPMLPSFQKGEANA